MKVLLSMIAMLATLQAFDAVECRAQIDENFMKASLLIDDNLAKNTDSIQAVAKDLNLTQKMVLFREYKKATVLPFVLNLFLATGIGSWVQGRTFGGVVGTVGTVGGVGLLLNKNTQEAGAVILAVTYVTGLILPWNHASSYNKKLKHAIGIENISLLYLGPTVNLAANGPVVPGIGVHVGF
jgi:hypothetical protein